MFVKMILGVVLGALLLGMVSCNEKDEAGGNVEAMPAGGTADDSATEEGGE